MKISQLMLFGVFFIGISSLEAQEKTSLTLDEAVKLAWEKSSESSLANSKVNSKKYELQTAKDSQYPDLKLSSQYQYFPTANIHMESQSSDNSSDGSAGAAPKMNQVVFAQAGVTMPLFSGFKIQNNVDLRNNMYLAESASAVKTKEDVALRTVQYYTNLYKAQKSLELLEENKKSTQQRVTDFIELEKNGIIPKNDLLKAQLQLSRVQLLVDEAKNNVSITNYYLVTLLKMDPNTKIVVNEADLTKFEPRVLQSDTQIALENRKDLESVRLQSKASENNIKIAKSSYYPSIVLLGGYALLDVKNFVNATNLTNVGVGLSYDLSGLIKNSNNVKAAESKSEEVKHSEEILTDHIKVQVQKAAEDYDLAISQDAVFEQAVAQASENYRLVKDKYDNGLSDTNDLLEADVDQLSTQINKALSKANIIQKYYELLTATGQISQSFNLSKI
ncbi:outer membrane protein TolC [Flavobacterium cutihirudinis]|uniref:Outer membrane protein TolC n=1 Tax=Flavobacterium cutihirudinis TaxID=1265740 RepID=A0A3D9FT54_9FLAO|nr:TolC family protein [Flavobacterium cutihirudinis]RED23755.1 outer membrane protein TolC [Flavobacterium cutihirudinis]